VNSPPFLRGASLARKFHSFSFLFFPLPTPHAGHFDVCSLENGPFTSLSTLGGFLQENLWTLNPRISPVPLFPFFFFPPGKAEDCHKKRQQFPLPSPSGCRIQTLAFLPFFFFFFFSPPPGPAGKLAIMAGRRPTYFDSSAWQAEKRTNGRLRVGSFFFFFSPGFLRAVSRRFQRAPLPLCCWV